MENTRLSLISAVCLFALIQTGQCKPFEDEYYDYNYGSSDDELPTFISRPQAFTVEVGQSVIFPCYVKGKANHVLIIKKESTAKSPEKLIAVGGKKLIQTPRLVVEESRLTINRVWPRDAGTYICTYASAPNAVLRHTLNVQYPPSIRASVPSHHRVPKDSSVTLQCEAEGNPPPSIRWSRQEGPLPSGVQSFEGSTLTLENVGRNEEGSYVCTADNGIGEPSSAVITVVVEYPPEIATEKSIIRTGEGDKVELVCIVKGRPSPQVSWTRDGHPVAHSSLVTEIQGSHRHILEVKPVSEKDFGAYVCIAENSQGQESAVIQMTGLPRQPLITSSPTGGESNTYTITFETESYYPVTEYRIMFRRAQANLSTTLPGAWRDVSKRVLPGENLTTNVRHVLRHLLTGLDVATDYEAVVRVKNKYGWSSDSEIFPFSTRKVLAVQQSTFGSFFSFASSSATIDKASLIPMLILAMILNYV